MNSAPYPKTQSLNIKSIIHLHCVHEMTFASPSTDLREQGCRVQVLFEEEVALNGIERNRGSRRFTSQLGRATSPFHIFAFLQTHNSLALLGLRHPQKVLAVPVGDYVPPFRKSLKVYKPLKTNRLQITCLHYKSA